MFLMRRSDLADHDWRRAERFDLQVILTTAFGMVMAVALAATI